MNNENVSPSNDFNNDQNTSPNKNPNNNLDNNLNSDFSHDSNTSFDSGSNSIVEPPQKKKSPVLVILIISIIALTILSVVLFILLLSSQSNQNTNVDNPNSSNNGNNSNNNNQKTTSCKSITLSKYNDRSIPGKEYSFSIDDSCTLDVTVTHFTSDPNSQPYTETLSTKLTAEEYGIILAAYEREEMKAALAKQWSKLIVDFATYLEDIAQNTRVVSTDHEDTEFDREFWETYYKELDLNNDGILTSREYGMDFFNNFDERLETYLF